jgi:AcrR family transcriptional regulator
MPKGVPLTEEKQAKRRHAIVQQAAGIFLKKGFHETSMQEIAKATGLGKSTLYDYFKTKDEILVCILEEQFDNMTEEARNIALQDLPPDQRLRLLMEKHIENLQANKSLFMKLTAESQCLKLESQRQLQDKRQTYQDLIRAIIDEGIHAGNFRQVNSLLAARLLVDAVNPPRAGLNETLGIFFQGISTRT